MATAKQCHTLVTYYQTLYKMKYGESPLVNRHSARWGFDSVLYDMSLNEAKALLDYYFTTESEKSHSLDWFFYNYEKLEKAKEDHEDDVARLAKLREESRQRAEEWRQKFGDQSITTD